MRFHCTHHYGHHSMLAPHNACQVLLEMQLTTVKETCYKGTSGIVTVANEKKDSLWYFM